MNEDKVLNNDEGVSIGEIFSWIWKKKILGLIIFVVVALISFLAIFFISKNKTNYVVNFDYGTTPYFSDNKYLDGTNFNFYNLVKEDVLQTVKDNSENKAYNDIDIANLVKSISITKVRETEEESNELLDEYYQITVSANCFTSDDQARAYLIDLINLPLNKNEAFLNTLTFDINLTNAVDSKTYQEEVTYIKDQVNLLTSGYDSLISTFGNVSIYVQQDSEGNVTFNTYDGVNSEIASSVYTLSQLRNRITDLIARYNYNYLEDIIEANMFVKINGVDDKGAIDYYNTLYKNRQEALKYQNANIEKQLVNLNNQINEIIGSTSGTPLVDLSVLQGLIDQRAALTAQQTENDIQLENIEEMLNMIKNPDNDFADDVAFGTRLEELRQLISEETKTYTSIYVELYNRINEVNYRQAAILDTTGGISLIINAAISVILGLIVGAVVAGVVGYNSTKKRNGILLTEEKA